jgi:hypothetical protein
MGFNNLARAKSARATGISCAGGLHVQQPDAATLADLKRADQFIPFSPETFLDELVQLFTVAENGASVQPAQFRTMPADVRASVAAAFLEHFAGSATDAEAALPRKPAESDAAYLLRFWRDGTLRAAPDVRAPRPRRAAAEAVAPEPATEPAAEPAPSDESKLTAGSLGQMDLTQLRLVPAPLREPAPALSSDIPSLNVSPGEAMAPELTAAPDAIDGPIHGPIGGVIDRTIIAEAPAPRGNGAMLVAVIAVLLALGGIGISAMLFLRQDIANQRMMATMRQQQDALEATDRVNRQTIDQLNEALRQRTAGRAASAAAPAPAAAPVAANAPVDQPAVPQPPPNLRAASSAGTPRSASRRAAAAPRDKAESDDETLAGVLDNAAGQGGEALPPSADSPYVDPRYGDPRYNGPQYPVRRGDAGNGYSSNDRGY